MGVSDLFKNVFKKDGTSVLGIDVGSSAIKIVQLKKEEGRAVLETYGELALGPYAHLEVGQATNLPTTKLVEAMMDLLNEKEVAITTRDSGIAIPVFSSFMSFIELPQVSDKELATMIPLEARKYIPVPISEVTLSWSIIPKDKIDPGSTIEESKDNSKEKIDVLVIAIHNDVINKYRDILMKTSLEATFMEIEAFSTIRSVIEDHLKPQMILDFGASTTKVYMVERGVLKISHTINRGSQDITSTLSKALNVPMKRAEVIKRTKGLINSDALGLYSQNEQESAKEISSLALDYIFSEAKRVLATFQRKHGKNVDKVILSGGGAMLKGFRELAQKHFETEVVFGNPFSKVEAPAFLSEVLKESGPEFAVAMGLALRKLEELD